MGIARTTGDSFTFIIITGGDKKEVALHQSVIRRRQGTDNKRHMDYDVNWEVPVIDTNTNDMMRGIERDDMEQWKNVLKHAEGGRGGDNHGRYRA